MHIPWLTDFVIFAQENGAPAAGQGAERGHLLLTNELILGVLQPDVEVPRLIERGP